jgi:hypothetical protein
VGIIAGLADQKYTDPRNAKAIALAKKITKVYKEHGAGPMV